MRLSWAFIPALSGMIVSTALAGTDTTMYYHAGGWDAFTGRGDNNHAFCGVGSTNPADGRSLSIRFEIGGDQVIFEARKPGWSIPDGTTVPATMTVGSQTPWVEQATATGNALRWMMDRNTIQTFDEQFRRGDAMTVAFPSGNEPLWTISLIGSTAISNAFGRCVRDLSARATLTQDAAATQPFTPAAEKR